MSLSLSIPDDAFTQDKSGPIWEGYLLKQGGARGGFRNWKKRWFRLDRENLCYYKQKPTPTSTIDDAKNAVDSEEPVLGVLPIRSATITDIRSDDTLPKASDNPVCWDIGAVSCHNCNREFSEQQRRRFCRSCGLAFCHLCSPRTVILSKFGFMDPVRVCGPCFSNLAGNFKSSETTPLAEDGVINVVIEPRKNRGFEWRQKKNLFILNSAELQLYFQAESITVKQDIMTAIRSVVKYHRHCEIASQSSQKLLSPSDSKVVNKRHILDRQQSASSQWHVDFKAIKILQEIGEGTSGMVYKGRLWGTDVAVKTISDDALAEDLHKEVAILSQLRHPNVVLYIGACLEPPNVAVVTEWCDRGSLFDLLHDESSAGCSNIDFQTIISIAIGIAQGMNYLHSLNQKIIHRDLKSQNILVDWHFTSKVADFGLSKVKQPTRFGDKIDVPIVSESLAIGHKKALLAQNNVKTKNNAKGKYSKHESTSPVTAEWMAPEVMEGAPYNQSVDIYSFGIVLSELLTRNLPFRDEYNITCYADVLEAVLDKGAVPTIPSWSGLKMQKLVSDCVNRNAEARPTFNEIILRLRSFYPLEPKEMFQKYDGPRLLAMLDSSDFIHQFRAVRELSDISHDLTDNCHVCGHTPLTYSLMDDSTLFGSVQHHALVSLNAIISQTDGAMRHKLLITIREDGGVQRVLSCLKSGQTDVARAASGLASMIIADGVTAENTTPLAALSSQVLEELMKIAQQEALELRAKIAANNASLARKQSLSAWLLNRLKQAEFAASDTQTALASIITPRTVVAASTAAQPEVSPTRIGTSFEEKDLPSQLRAQFGQGAQCWGWLGLLDVAGEQWMDVYGILMDATISIFDSEESRPDQIRFIIRIKVNNVCAKFRAGRKRGRANCLQIALSTELLPVAVDPNAAPIRRLFINLGNAERFAFWVKHINEHLDIPVPLTHIEEAVGDPIADMTR